MASIEEVLNNPDNKKQLKTLKDLWEGVNHTIYDNIIAGKGDITAPYETAFASMFGKNVDMDAVKALTKDGLKAAKEASKLLRDSVSVLGDRDFQRSVLGLLGPFQSYIGLKAKKVPGVEVDADDTADFFGEMVRNYFPKL